MNFAEDYDFGRMRESKIISIGNHSQWRSVSITQGFGEGSCVEKFLRYINFAKCVDRRKVEDIR